MSTGCGGVNLVEGLSPVVRLRDVYELMLYLDVVVPKKNSK